MKTLTPALIIHASGREVCRPTPEGHVEYRHRVAVMWLRQEGRCCLCHQPLRLAEATFEHEAGRGMGGGSRDDRVSLPDGTRINGAAHALCNAEKGSQRGTYNR